MNRVAVDRSTDVTALLHELGDGIVLEAGGTVVARMVPVHTRPAYIGLYGNHPYEVAARHEVRVPELRPEDFED